MSSKSKKTVKIVLTIILFIVVVLITLPFLFKDKVKQIALRELNKQLTADVGFEKLSISLIRNFPDASVRINNLYVSGREDFVGDTLLRSNDATVVVNLKSLFKGRDFEIKKILINDSKVFAHQLEDGHVNWDITPDKTTEKEKTTSEFNLRLKDVKISNTDVIYLSDSSNMAATLRILNINLKGDFSADKTLIHTQLNIDSLNFWNEGIRYANNLLVDFNADIDADFNQSKYTLANNEMKINAIPLSLNGWVQLPDEGMEMDLTLNSEKVDFKSLLSLIPAIYSTQFDRLTAEGNVSLNGFVKGKYLDEHYPALDLNLKVENGQFSYPDLPKSLENVQVTAQITHPGGSLELMVVDVPQLNFSLGKNPFSAQLHIEQPVTDPDFKLKAKGKLDLGMIKDFYPLDKGTELNGLLLMDVDGAGKMSYVEQNQYERFSFKGITSVNDLLVKTEELPQTVAINTAGLTFNDRYLDLFELDIKIGENDLSGSGKVENYLAYALRDKTLKGEMTVHSDYLNLNDFMSKEKDTTSLQVIEIPQNLNLALNGSFETLVYDKINLQNAEAQLLVANGELTINKMNVDAFGGNMALDGKYSTQNPAQPEVDFNIDLKQISFAEIFNQVESLQKFAPVLEKLAGQFNTRLSLSTSLSDKMKPVLSSVVSSGNLKAETVTLKENLKVFDELAKSFKIDKFNNLALRDISLSFDINEGKLETHPFDLNFKDYNLNLGGTTGLDQSILYKGSLKMPDKLNLGRFQTIGFKIGGTFQKPTVELDLKSTISELVEQEKNKVTGKVDSIKTQITDEGKAAYEKALEEAQKRADLILNQAETQGNRLINEARVQGDSIVSKAKNPIAKELARKAADELIRQAQKQADNLNEKAKTEAEKIIQSVEEKEE